MTPDRSTALAALADIYRRGIESPVEEIRGWTREWGEQYRHLLEKAAKVSGRDS